ncbi:MAG: AAA domain-containing protein [Muribaculaceae bacterium]|nr:AAA domain-containing protein [Muribaculaceae bacterium]
MDCCDFSTDYLAELALISASEATVQIRYSALAGVFHSIIDEATAASSINFSGPFAKTDYLLREHRAPEELRRAVHGARVRIRRHALLSEEELRAYIGADTEAVRELLLLLCGDTPAAISAPPPRSEVRRESAAAYLRVAVQEVSDNVLICISDEEQPRELRVVLRPEEAYIGTIAKAGTQLNLIGPRQGSGSICAEYIIYEPDMLMNITGIARCFESYGTDARTGIVKMLSPAAASRAIDLGNFASQLLDTCIHSGPPRYEDAVRDFFRANAHRLVATPPGGDDFHEQGRRQLANIAAAVGSHLPKHVRDFDPRKVMLEPVFISEALGLQGRMDLLQLDYRVLIEQKAGKGEWPQADYSVPRQRTEHYVQLLLYMALIRYNFPEVYRANDGHLSAFLMYSRYSRPLISPGFADQLLGDALEIRNMSVWYMERLAEGDDGFLRGLTPEALATRASGKLWDAFQRPQLEAVLNPIRDADSLSRSYYFRMLRFVALEHQLAKTGNKSKQASGFAALWQNSLAEKTEAGNIFAGLALISPDSTHSGAVSTLCLSFADDGKHDMANFRIGDMVILYPYARGGEPDARRTMVFRCTITEISARTITLELRFPQSSALPFIDPSAELWAIEHDFMDASFSGLYQGVQAFLTMPAQRRDLLLCRRAPAIDSSQRLRLDHGDFNSLALRVKQARELFLIIGPPGTGKTSYGLMSTLREELTEERASVLLLSYTNRAVDEICSKLEDDGLDYLRIGPETSCAPAYRSHLLSTRAGECPNIGAVRKLIADCRIVAATTSSMSAAMGLLSIKRFSLAIIDEASQIVEPHLLGILSAGTGTLAAIGRIVMIGDHKQLPAVVQQTQAESAVAEPELRAIGLTDCRLSLFERLLRQHAGKPEVVYMLTRQGRMHADIAAFPSRTFYGGLLSEVPLPHQTAPLPDEGGLFARGRMIFVDVPAEPTDTASDKVNTAEAAAIVRLAEAIHSREPDFGADTLGVIVPYRNQIAAVRAAFAATGIEALTEVTVDTVERYQGSQRKYIIYGFTVKRPYQLRFLTEHTFEDDGATIDRKLNVALTRAREYMICTGDSTLLRRVPLFGRLIDACYLTDSTSEAQSSQ